MPAADMLKRIAKEGKAHWRDQEENYHYETGFQNPDTPILDRVFGFPKYRKEDYDQILQSKHGTADLETKKLNNQLLGIGIENAPLQTELLGHGVDNAQLQNQVLQNQLRDAEDQRTFAMEGADFLGNLSKMNIEDYVDDPAEFIRDFQTAYTNLITGSKVPGLHRDAQGAVQDSYFEDIRQQAEAERVAAERAGKVSKLRYDLDDPAEMPPDRKKEMEAHMDRAKRFETFIRGLAPPRDPADPEAQELHTVDLGDDAAVVGFDPNSGGITSYNRFEGREAPQPFGVQQVDLGEGQAGLVPFDPNTGGFGPPAHFQGSSPLFDPITGKKVGDTAPEASGFGVASPNDYVLEQIGLQPAGGGEDEVSLTQEEAVQVLQGLDGPEYEDMDDQQKLKLAESVLEAAKEEAAAGGSSAIEGASPMSAPGGDQQFIGDPKASFKYNFDEAMLPNIITDEKRTISERLSRAEAVRAGGGHGELTEDWVALLHQALLGKERNSLWAHEVLGSTTGDFVDKFQNFVYSAWSGGRLNEQEIHNRAAPMAIMAGLKNELQLLAQKQTDAWLDENGVTDPIQKSQAHAYASEQVDAQIAPSFYMTTDDKKYLAETAAKARKIADFNPSILNNDNEISAALNYIYNYAQVHGASPVDLIKSVSDDSDPRKAAKMRQAQTSVFRFEVLNKLEELATQGSYPGLKPQDVAMRSELFTTNADGSQAEEVMYLALPADGPGRGQAYRVQYALNIYGGPAPGSDEDYHAIWMPGHPRAGKAMLVTTAELTKMLQGGDNDAVSYLPDALKYALGY